MKWKNPPYKPRMYDDEDIAAISLWCRIHGYTAHVKLNGQVELRKNPCKNLDGSHPQKPIKNLNRGTEAEDANANADPLD